MSARNDACEVLRSIFVTAQNSDAAGLDSIAQQLRELADHMDVIAHAATNKQVQE